MKRMLEIDFLTFKKWDLMVSFKLAHMREAVHMTGLHTSADDAASLEKTSG